MLGLTGSCECRIRWSVLSSHGNKLCLHLSPQPAGPGSDARCHEGSEVSGEGPAGQGQLPTADTTRMRGTM